MMTLLAGAFSFFGGGWALRLITIPLLCVAALVGFHVCVESWKNNLKAAGAAQCNADWEQKIRAQERQSLGSQLETSNKMLLDERAITEALNADNDALRDRYNKIVLSADPKCLSGGVLNELGGPGVEQQPDNAKARRPKPHTAKPAGPSSLFDWLLPDKAPVKKGGGKRAGTVSGSDGDADEAGGGPAASVRP